MTGLLAACEVAVIGGGVAGLAVATSLAQRGARVVLHEQAEAITEVGAGLQVSPNGMAVLSALGLGEVVVRAGVEARAVVLRDYRHGSRVARLDLARAGARYPFVMIHRADLIAALLRGCQDAGVEIRLGAKVSPGDLDASLIIGADGLHSGARATLNGDMTPFFTGQVAWRAVVPDADETPQAQVWMAPGRHLVSYPLGRGRRNIVAVEERQAWAEEGWHHPGDPDALRTAFAGFAAPVDGWLARVEQVHLWGLFRHPVAARWQDGRLAILGDAAHPTLPFLAQGANLALEDAWSLAAHLDRLPQAEALAEWAAKRAPRVTRAIEAANANARNYHLSNPPLRAGAHGVLRLVDRLAPGALMGRFGWLYGYDVTAEG